MSDVIYQGVVNKTGAPPFETAAPSPSPESEPIDVVSRGVPDAISGGSDEERVLNSVSELRRQREQGGEIDDIGKRPITQIHYDGREHGDKSLREVTRDVSDYHRAQRPDVQSAIRDYGGHPSEVISRAQNPDFIQQLRPDWTFAECQEFARSGIEPATKIGVVNYAGKLVRPLHDDQPVTINDAFGSRHELKQGVKNFRAAQAEQQQMLLNELAAAQEQAAAEQQQAAAPQTQQSAEPAQQTTTTPAPQPDQLAAERAALTQERDAYVRARYGSAAEEKAAAQIEAWNAALLRQFPEAKNQAAMEELTRRNPARAQQLMQAAQKTAEAVNGWMQAGARATAERERAAYDLSVIQHAQTRAAWHQYKEAEDAKVAQFIPADPHQASVLREGVRKMLNEIGFANPELDAAWNGQSGFSVRDARAQRLILDAFRWRQAQTKARNVTKAGLPPVQTPGVARPRGGGDFEAVARLQADLRNASGDRAVRLATKLQQARRSAGM